MMQDDTQSNHQETVTVSMLPTASFYGNSVHRKTSEKISPAHEPAELTERVATSTLSDRKLFTIATAKQRPETGKKDATYNHKLQIGDRKVKSVEHRGTKKLADLKSVSNKSKLLPFKQGQILFHRLEFEPKCIASTANAVHAEVEKENSSNVKCDSQQVVSRKQGSTAPRFFKHRSLLGTGFFRGPSCLKKKIHCSQIKVNDHKTANVEDKCCSSVQNCKAVVSATEVLADMHVAALHSSVNGLSSGQNVLDTANDMEQFNTCNVVNVPQQLMSNDSVILSSVVQKDLAVSEQLPETAGNSSQESQEEVMSNAKGASLLTALSVLSANSSPSGQLKTVNLCVSPLSNCSSPRTPRSGSAMSITSFITRKRKSDDLLSSASKRDKKEQMILDFGQKMHGTIHCGECGMTYSKFQPTDELTHSQYHKSLFNTLKFTNWKSERVAHDFEDGGHVVVISPDNKRNSKRVEDIKNLVDRELGYVVERPVAAHAKTFLYVTGTRVVGFCLAQQITHGYRMLPPNSVVEIQDVLQVESSKSSCCCSENPTPARCGISRIWVLASERHKHIASRLLDVVRGHFLMGYPITKDELAFSDPTPDGIKFAAKYTGTHCFLVYRNLV